MWLWIKASAKPLNVIKWYFYTAYSERPKNSSLWLNNSILSVISHCCIISPEMQSIFNEWHFFLLNPDFDTCYSKVFFFFLSFHTNTAERIHLQRQRRCSGNNFISALTKLIVSLLPLWKIHHVCLRLFKTLNFLNNAGCPLRQPLSAVIIKTSERINFSLRAENAIRLAPGQTQWNTHKLAGNEEKLLPKHWQITKWNISFLFIYIYFLIFHNGA